MIRIIMIMVMRKKSFSRRRDKITQMTNGELEKQIVSLSWKAISTQALSSSAVTTPKKTV